MMRELTKEHLTAWLQEAHDAFPDCGPAGDAATRALQVDLLIRHAAVRRFIAQAAKEFGLSIRGVPIPTVKGVTRQGMIEQEQRQDRDAARAKE